MNDRKFRGLMLLIVIIFALINVWVIVGNNVIDGLIGIFGIGIIPLTIILGQIILGLGSALVLLGALIVFNNEKLGKILMFIGGFLTIPTTGIITLLILLIFRKKFD